MYRSKTATAESAFPARSYADARRGDQQVKQSPADSAARNSRVASAYRPSAIAISSRSFSRSRSPIRSSSHPPVWAESDNLDFEKTTASRRTWRNLLAPLSALTRDFGFDENGCGNGRKRPFRSKIVTAVPRERRARRTDFSPSSATSASPREPAVLCGLG